MNGEECKMKNEMINTNGIWYKVQNFFRNIFGKNKSVIEEASKKEEKKEMSKFRDTIIIQKNEERERLIKLQNQLRNKKIKEEELTLEDIEKISILYDEQIKEIEEEIKKNRDILEEYKKKLTAE